MLGFTKCGFANCNNTLCNGYVFETPDGKKRHVVKCRFWKSCTNSNCRGYGTLQEGQFVHCEVRAKKTDNQVEEYRKFVPASRTLGQFFKGAKGFGKGIDDDADEKTSTSTNASKGGGKGAVEPSFRVPRVEVKTILTKFENNQTWGELCESSDDELESLQSKIAKSEMKINELREKAKKLEQDAVNQKIKKDKESVLNVKDSLDKIETIGQFEETVEFWIETIKRIVPADDHKDLVQYLTRELDISEEDSS